MIAKHNLNSQQTAKHPSLNNKTNRAFLESEIVVEIYWPNLNILLEKWQMGSQPTYIPPASLPLPFPSLVDVESNAYVAYCFFFPI